MEDVPDMAVKFAVYETLRPIHAKLTDGRQVGAPGPTPRAAGRSCLVPVMHARAGEAHHLDHRIAC